MIRHACGMYHTHISSSSNPHCHTAGENPSRCASAWNSTWYVQEYVFRSGVLGNAKGQDLCAYVRVATLLMLFLFFARYNTARKIKESQDQYCSKAIAGHWDDLGEFPEDLQWEALVDVLRGRVKVKYLSVLFETIVFTDLHTQIQTHCYEASG